MTWNTKTEDAEEEKEIITALITNDNYIKEIQQFFRKELLQIPFSKTISQWCFDYFKKYKKAPGKYIQEMYNNYADGNKVDESQVELIGKFLSNLSMKYEKSNYQYHIDKAEKYFRKRHIQRLKENLNVYLTNDKLEDAEREIGGFKRIERPRTVGVDIIRDNINSILFAEDDVLFKFPGALGELMSGICREDYLIVAAPMKRGKSWWLQEIGLRALVRDLNVIYYSLEMSEKKLLRRIYQYFLGETKKEETIEIPYFTDENTIEYREVHKEGISGERIQTKRKRIETMLGSNAFRLCTFPTRSINVDDIRVHLDNLDHYNHFIPDVIIVDYADIMAPEKTASKDERARLNETQLALRGLAQERHCVVVTGTQTTVDTFKKNIEEESMADDKRKLAHATSVLALNQTKDEKKKGIMRISMVVVRDDEFHLDDEVAVLQCLKIGRPCLDSRWAKNIEF